MAQQDEPILTNHQYSAMEPIGIPPEAKTLYPDSRAVHIGPPPGIGDDECGTPEVLVIPDPLYGVALADYWRPTAEQLEILNTGGYLELRQYTNVMVMHSLTIHTTETESRQTPLSELAIVTQRLHCTVCEELIMPFEESVPDAAYETDDRWAHRDCMEAGE